MKPYKKSLLSDYRDETRREKIEFRGREYTKPGRYWAVTHAAALLNPSERLLALQSFTGSRTGEPPAQLKEDGTIYIEVYATDTGKPLCRIRGDHKSTFGADLLHGTFWLDENYLIASSISPDDMQRFLFCDFKPRMLR
ncbi:MAG: hypothetical protein U0R19_00540 [Bryobacteraceae bacterium]